MKNFLVPIIATSALVFLACAPELVEPLQPAQVNHVRDTIVTYDSNTLEKIVKIVVDNEEAIPNAVYGLDTVITFDGETFEETMEIFRTRIVSIQETTAKNSSSNTTQPIAEKIGDPIYQIDTIITFDPETFEETIQVIKTRTKRDN